MSSFSASSDPAHAGRYHVGLIVHTLWHRQVRSQVNVKKFLYHGDQTKHQMSFKLLQRTELTAPSPNRIGKGEFRLNSASDRNCAFRPSFFAAATSLLIIQGSKASVLCWRHVAGSVCAKFLVSCGALANANVLRRSCLLSRLQRGKLVVKNKTC